MLRYDALGRVYCHSDYGHAGIDSGYSGGFHTRFGGLFSRFKHGAPSYPYSAPGYLGGAAGSSGGADGNAPTVSVALPVLTTRNFFGPSRYSADKFRSLNCCISAKVHH
jgi:hypothetical protein